MKLLALFILSILPGLAAAETSSELCKTYTKLEDIQSEQKKLGFSDARLTQWHKAEKEASVTVSIHGLNLKPDKMTDVIGLFNQSKSSVLNVTLQGHGENFESFEEVTKDKWVQEFHNAYCIAFNYASKKKIPLYFFGYSTGGTVAIAAKIRNEKYEFKKQVLMAPALKMTKFANLIRVIFPFEFLNIPSSNKNDYIAHKSTPIPAYKALFQLSDEILDNEEVNLNNSETLILIDPRDELVSYEGLIEIIEDRGLSNWSMFTVFTSTDRSKTRAPHHSIIDEYFSGKEVWSQIATKTKSFLKTGT